MIFHIGFFVGTCLLILTVPGTLELLVLTVAGMLPARRIKRRVRATEYRIAVIVPAHNEELTIGRCVTSLLSADRSCIGLEVMVVADNCDDQTAKAAVESGASVRIRENRTLRGKGYALDFAFRDLASGGWDAYAVVDADTEVANNFLTEIAANLAAGAAALQCRYLVRNSRESVRTRLMSIAVGAFNVLRLRGRDRLALSCGLLGNGFALSAATLSAVPYTANSIVEDLEYHLALVSAGRKVMFVDTTAVYGDMPSTGSGVSNQRARWEGGRFRMIREKAPQLFRSILAGQPSLIEPLGELLLLPIALHTLLLLLAAATPSWPVRAAAVASLGLVGLHLVAAIFVTGGGVQDVACLFAAPFYLIWKVLMIPRILKSARPETAWVRTERALPRNLP